MLVSAVLIAREFPTNEHFFDTTYYPCLGAVAGLPYGVWVHGNNDTAGAASAVRKIATGWGLELAAEALELTKVNKEARDSCYELGGTLAATLMG